MEIDVKKNKEEFIELLRSTKREGIEYLIEDLDKWNFFEAPASAAHHLNVAGGLVQHSLNACKAALCVWEGMKNLDSSLDNEVKRENVIIATLLHDLCKADLYVRTIRRTKNAIGVWEDSEGYKLSFKNFPFGHGEKSVVLALCSGVDLTDAEMLAIRWHMGAWEVNMSSYEERRHYDASKKLSPLVTLVQVGDGLAASILERSGCDIDEL